MAYGLSASFPFRCLPTESYRKTLTQSLEIPKRSSMPVYCCSAQKGSELKNRLSSLILKKAKEEVSIPKKQQTKYLQLTELCKLLRDHLEFSEKYQLSPSQASSLADSMASAEKPIRHWRQVYSSLVKDGPDILDVEETGLIHTPMFRFKPCLAEVVDTCLTIDHNKHSYHLSRLIQFSSSSQMALSCWKGQTRSGLRNNEDLWTIHQKQWSASNLFFKASLWSEVTGKRPKVWQNVYSDPQLCCYQPKAIFEDAHMRLMMVSDKVYTIYESIEAYQRTYAFAWEIHLFEEEML